MTAPRLDPPLDICSSHLVTFFFLFSRLSQRLNKLLMYGWVCRASTRGRGTCLHLAAANDVEMEGQTRAVCSLAIMYIHTYIYVRIGDLPKAHSVRDARTEKNDYKATSHTTALRLW